MWEIVCEHCKSRYLLPAELREAMRGRLATCAVCTREWTPLPADPRGSLGKPTGPTFVEPLALHPYLQSNPYAGPDLGSGGGPVARSTTQAVRRRSVGATPNLRVAASGPGLELDAVFELGSRSFFVGSHDSHLELFHAGGLPERAIRIAATEGGFEIEGLNGYLIPLGPLSVAAGKIEAGSKLDLVISPYRVTLEATAEPGGPIRDLDQPPSSPATPAAPAPTLAPAPAPARAVPPVTAVDVSSTVRGLGVVGFDVRRFSSPLEEIDVGLLGLDPPVQGETFWLKKSPTLIGRTTGDILLADSRVSGKHAQIDVLALDQYALKDLASTNGTTVNDRPTSTTRLKDGDILGFGGVRLQFVARPKQRRS